MQSMMKPEFWKRNFVFKSKKAKVKMEIYTRTVTYTTIKRKLRKNQQNTISCLLFLIACNIIYYSSAFKITIMSFKNKLFQIKDSRIRNSVTI